LFVTAAHALRRRSDSVELLLADGRTVIARIAGVDAPTDLAALVAEGEGVAARALADVAAVKPGDLVVAVGRARNGDVLASAGIVRRSAGSFRSWLGGTIDRLVQLDFSLAAGVTGGPVANAAGEVIGIATPALSRSGAIVVPAVTVSRIVEQLVTEGRAARGFLGLVVQPARVPRSDASEGDATQDVGLLVADVAERGPAATAGVLVGDILLRVGDTPLAAAWDLRSALDGHRSGDVVNVTLVRGGARVDTSLTVGDRPVERRCH
jgi:S1-C subfamily serine protease